MESRCVHVSHIFLVNFLFTLSATALAEAQKKALVSALYIFGDSTIDPGNNNGLDTIIKANFPPYGRDFLNRRPTGRFTDGKLVTDILSELAALPDLLPAYLDPEFRGEKLLTGASFGSSGSGYAHSTALDVLAILQNVYSEGCTKLVIIGLPPFGCLPLQITLHNLLENTCVEEFNEDAMSFNTKIKTLAEKMVLNHRGLQIVYLDIYDTLADIVNYPFKY
ncbi:hypothetical protein KI387_014439, partial [Taxus chinensis]